MLEDIIGYHMWHKMFLILNIREHWYRYQQSAVKQFKRKIKAEYYYCIYKRYYTQEKHCGFKMPDRLWKNIQSASSKAWDVFTKTEILRL